MSRYYGMNFEVDGITRDEVPLVRDVISGIWEIESDYDGGTEVASCFYNAYGEHTLTGGEDEGEFATRAARAIWKALGRYVPVSVEAIDLENVPTASYSLDEDDYDSFLAEQETL